MTAIQEAPSLEQPLDILANCRKHNPQDDAYLRHPVINRFGSPEQSIYIDELTVNLNGIQYEQPLILPVHNALMCAEKTGGFNLVNYTYSSGVYHELETQDVYGRT